METMRQLISSSNLCDLRRDKTQKMLRLMSQKALMWKKNLFLVSTNGNALSQITAASNNSEMKRKKVSQNLHIT